MMEGGFKICWSLHGNKDICARYEILERVGSGTYSDVYRGRRKEDGLIVALKEVHDYQSSWREIDALQRLAGCPNVVTLYEWFWREHEDAVLVLEFLPSDLGSVIKAAKKDGGNGIPEAEVKAWMIQVLQGMAACHASSVAHRDVKPSNLLISSDGILKLADFGQARVLEPAITFVEQDDLPADDNAIDGSGKERLIEDNSNIKGVLYEGKGSFPNTNEEKPNDLAQMGNSDLICNNDERIHGSELTCGVGTRWYRAPELLYGSTQYGKEIDLWSLGCIFGELLSLEPLFPGTSDIDQLSRVVKVLGGPTKENWPGCPYLPDYGKIYFPNVHNPVGLRNHVPGCSESAFCLLERFVCYYPAARLSAVEALENKYFTEEPLPAFTHELRAPPPEKEDNNFSDDWEAWKIFESDADLGDKFNVIHSSNGYTIQFC